MYEIGSTLTWAMTIRDSAGALVDPGTGPTAAVVLPDGTSSAATVVRQGLGTFEATLVATQAGRHRITWTASGTNSSNFPYSEVADVWPADPRLIISLEDARNALNIPAASHDKDDEIRLYIAATTAVIEDIVGPVLKASVVERRSGDWRPSLSLWKMPSSVTSVVEDGVTLSATDYTLDEYGILWRGSSRRAGRWSGQTARNVVVTYQVGAAVVPSNVILAAREELRFLYQIGQQGGRPGLGMTTDSLSTGFTPSGFAVPNRVIELLAPSTSGRMAGIA